MANRHPNILFLLTDQHAPDAAGFAGDAAARTQHLDALAAGAVQFDTAVCASPVCTPSRMCLLTGKEQHRCAAWNNHWVIFPEHVTWPAHFAAHGYRTCLVGKMHFGGKDQHQGFQDRPYGDLRHGLGHQPDPIDLFPGYGHVSSASITDIPESVLQDQVVSRESLAWLLEHQDQQPDTPWFLCASYSRPHSPFTAPGRYIRRYRGKLRLPDLQPGEPESHEPYARRMIDPAARDPEQALRALEAYYACIDYVDDCIGELLASLRGAGLLDNTIVIYTSDHGEMMGRHGLWGKKTYYRESAGVPLLIAGPGVKRGHHRVRHPFSLIDLYPTTCALAGLPIPDGLDGVDQGAVLRDPGTAASPRRFVSSSCYRYGVRINFKPFSDEEPSAAMRLVQTADWKYVEVERGRTLLFDLANDPHENHNLADAPAHRERRAQMRAWFDEGFSWEGAREQLAADQARLPQFHSGVRPSTPNQYTLRDGRICDAETGLYDVRWLAIPADSRGGIIPQMPG